MRVNYTIERDTIVFECQNAIPWPRESRGDRRSSVISSKFSLRVRSE